MCVVYWKNLLAGFVSHGEPIKCADAWAWVNTTIIPDFIHWVEKVQP